MKIATNRRLQAILISAAVVILGSLSGWLPVNRWAAAVVRPIAKPLSHWGSNFNQKLHELTHLGSLEDQNRQLQEQNQKLNEQLGTFYQIQEEDQQLRQQLNLKQRSSLKLAAAEVINYQNDSLRRFIRIDKGQADGLRVGQTVLANGGLVGQVNKVSGHEAEVMLMSDPDFRALATTQNPNTTGVIEGQPGGVVTMERIPRDQPIKVGDTVLTSGLDGQFPRGLAIGVIENLQDATESIFISAQLKPVVGLDQLRVVLVVVP